MDHGHQSSSPDLILADSVWLGRFARKLIRDADLAEDLSQDVLFASLSGPTFSNGPPRPWLARVARNLAIGLARRESRRQRAERAAPDKGTAPETADVVAEAELQSAAVQALLKLHEPYRTALLWRFMKGMSCREMAKRWDVPVETVRTRIKRGLALLRAKLDKDQGGRAGWLPPLGIPALARRSTPMLWGIVLMKIKAKVLVAASLLLAGLFGIWQVTRPPTSVPDAPRQVADGMMAAALEQPHEAEVLDSDERQPLDPGTAPEEVSTSSLLVRVTWQDTGEPAAHVGLRIEENLWSAKQFASTGQDGTFLFENLEPGTFRVTMDRPKGNVYGHSDVELVAGEQVTLELDAGGRLNARGIVLDPDGIPVAGAEILVANGGTWPQWIYPNMRTGHDGTFFLRSLGNQEMVGARADGYGTSDFVLLQTATRGAPGEVALRLVLPPSSATLTGTVFDPEGKPVAGARVGVGKPMDLITLPDGTAGQNPPQTILLTDQKGAFKAVSLRPGRQPLYVYGEGFASWVQEVDCPPRGTTDITVQLQPGASLSGQITDEDGNPVEDVWIEIETEAYNVFHSDNAASDVEGRYRFEGLPGGEVYLVANSGGLGRAEANLHLLAGQETRWDLSLKPGLQIHGILVNESGEALEDWRLRTEDRSNGAATDANGRFVISNCEDRPYTIQVRQSWNFVPIITTLENVQPGAPERVFVVPDAAMPSAVIAGRVLTPEGRPAEGVGISLSQDTWPISDTPDTDAEGRFETGPLPPGTYQVSAPYPEYVAADFGEITLLPNEVHQLPDGRLRHGGQLDLTLRASDHQLEGLEIEVQAADGRRLSRGSVRGSVVDFRLLPAGAHKLSIKGPNVETQILPIVVKADETLSLEITLR